MLKITIVAKNIFLFFLQIQGDKIMRIRNLIMTGLIASGGFALTSCKKVPFQEMSTKYIPPVVTERIDSIAQASKQILANKNYQKFAEDTLELTKDFFNNFYQHKNYHKFKKDFHKRW